MSKLGATQLSSYPVAPSGGAFVKERKHVRLFEITGEETRKEMRVKGADQPRHAPKRIVRCHPPKNHNELLVLQLEKELEKGSVLQCPPGTWTGRQKDKNTGRLSIQKAIGFSWRGAGGRGGANEKKFLTPL